VKSKKIDFTVKDFYTLISLFIRETQSWNLIENYIMIIKQGSD